MKSKKLEPMNNMKWHGIKIIVQNNRNGRIFDISELVSDITIETHIEENPGKMTFTFINDGSVAFYEGSPVTFSSGGVDIFFGYIFTKSRNKDNLVKVTAYDQLRYLKNKDTYRFSEMTSAGIFERICTDYSLAYKIMDASPYITPTVTHDNKTLYEMMQRALDETFIYSGERIMLRDNFGTLEHIAVNSLKTNLVMGDGLSLMDYDYESSIDSDVYNQIKLVQENKQSGKRDVYIMKDANNIDLWGILQYHEKMNENANPAQITEKASMLLSLYNSVQRKLSVQCLGNFMVSAGCGMSLQLDGLGDITIDQDIVVLSCSHHIKNGVHTMKLDIEPFIEQKVL